MDASEVYSALDSLLPPLARTSNIPILAAQGGIFKQHGSGALFSVAGKSFLITAAHVIRDAAAAKAPLFVLPAESGRTVELAGEFFTTASTTRAEFRAESFKPSRKIEIADAFDVGFVRLADSVVDALSGKAFVTAADVISDPTAASHNDDVFCVIGCPTAMASMGDGENGGSGNLTTVKLFTSKYRGPTDELETLDNSTYRPSCHLLFNANRSNFCDEQGNEADFPADPGGISGGAVWCTLHDSRLARTAGQAKLAAVETHFYAKAGVIRATPFVIALKLIQKIYPELSAAFRLLLRRSL